MIPITDAILLVLGVALLGLVSEAIRHARVSALSRTVDALILRLDAQGERIDTVVRVGKEHTGALSALHKAGVGVTAMCALIGERLDAQINLLAKHEERLDDLDGRCTVQYRALRQLDGADDALDAAADGLVVEAAEDQG